MSTKITDLPVLEWCDYWAAGNEIFLQDERFCDEHTRIDLHEASAFIRQQVQQIVALKIAVRDAYRSGYHAGHSHTVDGNFSWCEQGSTEVANEWYADTFGEEINS